MTTENVHDYAAHDGVAPDRWASALHLFDNGVGVPREESVLERWERARLLFGAKDYIGAARLLAGIVGEVPEQTGPRLLLARAYYHSAQLRRAENQLRRIIDRDPVEHYAHLMLGRTLERQGRHDEASPWLRSPGVRRIRKNHTRNMPAQTR
ncbi:tetratricopeptide repeat protein [Streptomyces sp. P17]|uniref:tetratricopeptide repeat protein n=1 Tax=Streptomyces sp. P17 TaxID=3074716 RepID=UPI0028F3F9A2|nr:tetratricopeptide repeat protein [Streptomyces sp. P17]MDT9696899.1 tetratricopeptide repeat protein [Streptomyces sp. P17]